MKSVDRPAVTTTLALLLCTVGLLQLVGQGVEETGRSLDLPAAVAVGGALRAIGAATAASPLPRVFSSVEGFETFSNRFALSWDEADGPHVVFLTPRLYARLRGPYWRRNAYGAALAYGPLLARRESMQGLLFATLRFGLEGGAPLLEELFTGEPGIDPTRRTGRLSLCYFRPDETEPFEVIEVPR